VHEKRPEYQHCYGDTKVVTGQAHDQEEDSRYRLSYEVCPHPVGNDEHEPCIDWLGLQGCIIAAVCSLDTATLFPVPWRHTSPSFYHEISQIHSLQQI